METIFVLVSKEAWNKKQQEVIDLRKENERLQKENTQLQQESQRLRKDPDLFEMFKSRSVESRIEALETAGLEQFKDILRIKETFCNCPVKKFDDFEKRIKFLEDRWT